MSSTAFRNKKAPIKNFHEQDVELIHIIKQAQQLGFKLSEMKARLHKEASCQNFPWHLALRLVHEKMSRNFIRLLTLSLGEGVRVSFKSIGTIPMN